MDSAPEPDTPAGPTMTPGKVALGHAETPGLSSSARPSLLLQVPHTCPARGERGRGEATKPLLSFFPQCPAQERSTGSRLQQQPPSEQAGGKRGVFMTFSSTGQLPTVVTKYIRRSTCKEETLILAHGLRGFSRR